MAPTSTGTLVALVIWLSDMSKVDFKVAVLAFEVFLAFKAAKI